MILDALEQWLPDGNYLLSSARHGNTSTLLTYLTQKYLKQNRGVTVFHHFGESSAHQFNSLLAKCGINVTEIKEVGRLKYTDFICPLKSPPDLSSIPESIEGVSDNEKHVVVLTEIHLFLGLGCQLKDIVMLVQRLLRNSLVVIATSRDSPETKQLNTYLESMLGNCVTLDTLESGASAEVDGHVTRRCRGQVGEALYKGSERGFKVFPLGTAPGTV